MRRFFQNSGVFYSSLVLMALFCQWWVSRSYEDDLRAADREAEKPVKLIQDHYNDPKGMRAGDLTTALMDVQKRIFEVYKKLLDQIVFKPSNEYRVDSKSAVAAFDFQEKVKRFKTKNAKRLKELSTRLSATFLSGSILDPTPEKVAMLLHQAAILEELFARLDSEELLSAIESLQINPPRDEQNGIIKLIKKFVRYPIRIELTADPATLDRFFRALATGKNGYFFIEDMEMSQGADIDSWGEKVKCAVSLSAVSMTLEETIETNSITPAWAAGIRR